MGDPEKAMDVVDDNDHEDIEDEEEEAGASIESKLMSDPKIMAALQGKLQAMVGCNSGYIAVSISQFTVDFFCLTP